MPTKKKIMLFTDSQLVRIFRNFIFIIIYISIFSCSNTKNIACEDLENRDKEYFYQEVLYTGNCTVVKNEIIIEEKTIKDGKEIKSLGYYYPSGNLNYIGNMKKDSLNGKYIQYHDNGNIRMKGKFYMGFPNGKWKKYDELGKLQSIQFFKKGELIKTAFKNN